MSNSARCGRTPFLMTYLLFVLVFLACTAAMVAVCSLLGTHELPLPTDSASDAPAAPLPVIVIDAGHGGEDGGASGYIDGREVIEKHLNLDIALTLCELLSDAGYRAVLTRSEDTLLYDRNVDFKGRKKALDLAARLSIAERADAGGGVILVSLHMNTFSQAEYSGLQVYYSPNHPDSIALAGRIQATARAQLAPANDRRIKPSSDIALLDRLHCPAVLVECGFLSNPQECALLDTQEYRNRVAYAVFCALRSHLAENPTSQENEPPA